MKPNIDIPFNFDEKLFYCYIANINGIKCYVHSGPFSVNSITLYENETIFYNLIDPEAGYSENPYFRVNSDKLYTSEEKAKRFCSYNNSKLLSDCRPSEIEMLKKFNILLN